MDKKLLLASVGRLPFYSGESDESEFVPRIGLASLAAILPPEWDVELQIDRPRAEFSVDPDVSVVGFSVLTVFANETYELADEYRRCGVKVMMGGPHASNIPEDALQHADAVVVGEGESVLLEVLEDLTSGTSKGVYRGQRMNVNDLLMPRYDLLEPSRYSNVGVMLLSRSCPFQCTFCLVPTMQGRGKWRVKETQRAMDEVEWLRSRMAVERLCVLDCVHTYAVPFAEAMKATGLKWSASAEPEMMLHRDLVRKFNEGGCNYIYTEAEVASRRRDPKRYRELVDAYKAARDLGMGVYYNFTLGYERHDKSIFEDTVRFIEESGINTYVFQAFTPWPGLPEYHQLEAQGRLISKDWSRYNNVHVVHRPSLMTADELEEGIQKLYEHFYGAAQEKAYLNAVLETRTASSPPAPVAQASSGRRPETCQALLEALPLAFKPERAIDVDATIQFLISGSETLESHLEIKDQTCRLIQGRAENPTLTIDSAADIWLKVCTGQMDPRAAFLEGKYKVVGDMLLLMKMGVLFG